MQFIRSLFHVAPSPPPERGPARPPRETDFAPNDDFQSSGLPAIEHVRSQTEVSRSSGFFFGVDGKSAIEQGIRLSCPALSSIPGACLIFSESGGHCIAILQEGDKSTKLPALASGNLLQSSVSTELPNGLTVTARESLVFEVEIARADKTGFTLTWTGKAPEYGVSGTHGAPDRATFRGVDDHGDSSYVSNQRENRLQVSSSTHDWSVTSAGYTAGESKLIFENAKGILSQNFPLL